MWQVRKQVVAVMEMESETEMMDYEQKLNQDQTQKELKQRQVKEEEWRIDGQEQMCEQNRDLEQQANWKSGGTKDWTTICLEQVIQKVVQKQMWKEKETFSH